MENKGEKCVKFQAAGNHIASMQFQSIDELSRPLASAARVAAKGNRIVLDGEGCSSYIENKESKVRIPLRIEKGVYVMDVQVLREVEEDDSAFAGQA